MIKNILTVLAIFDNEPEILAILMINVDKESKHPSRR
jgi:hypothetical protein